MDRGASLDGSTSRNALVVEYIRPGVPQIVTVHSRIVAAQLKRAVGNIRVTSMAEIVAPALAAPCLDDGLLSVRRTPEGFSGVRAGDGHPRFVDLKPSRPRRGQWLLANLDSLIHPFEPSARILTAGLLGFLFILVLDTVATALVLGLPTVDAFLYGDEDHYHGWAEPGDRGGARLVKVFSSVTMLAALAFTALVTAGIVNRFARPPADHHGRLPGGSTQGPRGGDRPRPRRAAGGSAAARARRTRARGRERPRPLQRRPGEELRASRRHRPGWEPLPAPAALAGPGASAGGCHKPRGGEHLDRGGRAGHAGGPSHDPAGRARRCGERDAFAVQHRRGARCLPDRGTLLAAAALGSDATDAFLHEQTVYLITPDGRIEPFEPDVADVQALPTASAARPDRES